MIDGQGLFSWKYYRTVGSSAFRRNADPWRDLEREWNGARIRAMTSGHELSNRRAHDV